MNKIQEEIPEQELARLKELQNIGIKTIMRVVDIKSEEGQEEVTKAKERWAKSHFEKLNKRLKKINPINVEPNFRDDIYTHYIFDLLHPSDYDQWFYNLSKGLSI